MTVELTPGQALPLLMAWQREQARARHEAEPWPSQGERDAQSRDEYMILAVARGVSQSQAERFVYSGPISEAANS